MKMLSLQLNCALYGFPPPLPLPHSPPSLTPSVFVCEWSGIEDPESRITSYLVSISDTNNMEEIVVYEATLPGEVNSIE